MPKGVPTTLAERIQQLLDDRQQHLDALEKIDATLGQVGVVLGASPNGMKRRGRPPGSKNAAPAAEGGAPAPTKKKRRGRGAYETTAIDFVLGFLKDNKDATTQQINTAWKSAGRGNTADNTLTQLVKAKKLKRTPLEGKRGSTFALAS